MTANRTGTLVAPRGRWWSPLGKDEKLWFGMTAVWAVAMFAMIFAIWPLVGDRQQSFEGYRVEEAQFAGLTQQFIEEHGTGENLNGIPIVAPPPGSDVYMLATRFQFRPVIQLQRGETYRLPLSFSDWSSSSVASISITRHPMGRRSGCSSTRRSILESSLSRWWSTG